MMQHFPRSYRHTFILGIVLLIIGATPLLISHTADAQELENRSLFLASEVASVTTTHIFTFTIPDTNPIGAIEFQYCQSSLPQLPCIQPPGINVSAAIIASQSGETGFYSGTQTNNEILLARTPSAPANPGEQVSYTFTNVVNPSAANQIFYVRVSTYDNTLGTGPYTDFGGVANTTATVVTVNTSVPPILIFCVGQTVGSNCSQENGNFIDFGDITPAKPAYGTSEMEVGTNAASGIAITANGTTMTSGNNVIRALALPTISRAGTSQFGINLRANSVPPVGQDPSGPGVASPIGNYNIPNSFTYNSGDVVASSVAVTDFRTFTVSYLINTSSGQAAGVYDTTITYVCTGSF